MEDRGVLMNGEMNRYALASVPMLFAVLLLATCRLRQTPVIRSPEASVTFVLKRTPYLWTATASKSPPQGISPAASWITYTNTVYGFSLRHPPNMDVPPTDFDEPRGVLGDQVVFTVGERDSYWLGCLLEGLGDCPVVEHYEFKRVGSSSRKAIRIDGFVGSVDGRVPEEYVTYLMRQDGMYYAFTLYALGLDSEVDHVKGTWPLGEAEVVRFEQMLGTLRFRAGSGG